MRFLPSHLLNSPLFCLLIRLNLLFRIFLLAEYFPRPLLGVILQISILRGQQSAGNGLQLALEGGVLGLRLQGRPMGSLQGGELPGALGKALFKPFEVLGEGVSLGELLAPLEL